MIANMYSIHDKLGETWSNPFCMLEKVAQRNFSFMEKEMSAADKKDREICHVGYFDIETGEVKGIHPNPVYTFKEE